MQRERIRLSAFLRPTESLVLYYMATLHLSRRLINRFRCQLEMGSLVKA